MADKVFAIKDKKAVDTYPPEAPGADLVDLLSNTGPLTVEQIVKETGDSEETIRAGLTALMTSGIVVKRDYDINSDFGFGDFGG